MAAETELQALVVKLRADLSSFKSEMLKGQKVVADSALKMDKSIGEFTKSSESRMAGFSEAIETAFSVFKVGGGIAAAIEATKFAMDQIFEAENVRAVSVQFELLARNAGLAGAALREGLVGAADGLIDDTDLIKQANQSIIAMGATARDLPAVMELARKATAAFGGTAADNFTAMATAIANGNTKQLKNLGIVIDQEQAYKRFADKLGVSAESLNEAGRQQAMMNAVLEKGKTAYAGVTDEVIKSRSSWEQLKVSLGQIGETATVAFGKMAGPATTGLFAGINKWLKETNIALIDHFGSGAEQASAHTEHLKIKISGLKEDLANLEAVQARVGKGDPYNAAIRAKEIEQLHQQIYALSVELRKSQTAEEKLGATHKETQKTVKENKEAFVNLKTAQQEYAEQAIKFRDSLLESSPESVQKAALEELALARSEGLVTLEENYAIQRSLLEAKIAEEQALLDAARGKSLEDELKYQSAVQALQAQYALQKRKIDADEAKAEQEVRKRNLDNTRTILSNMATVARAFGEEGFAAFKAFASAEALISAYQGAAAAVAPPPVGAGPLLGPILAASTIAAGLANVAKINSTTYATGGIVPGTSTIGDQQLARVNSGEMILNAQQQSRLFNMIDGGGGGQTPALISTLIERVDRLSAALMQPIVLSVDGQVLFEAVRGQVRAGRVLA